MENINIERQFELINFKRQIENLSKIELQERLLEIYNLFLLQEDQKNLINKFWLEQCTGYNQPVDFKQGF
jgi:hypothetical protein